MELMENENKFKKISSVVPREVDFVEAIRYEFLILDCKLAPDRPRHGDGCILDMPGYYESKVRSARRRFWGKLSKVVDEFPSLGRLDYLYSSLLHQRCNMHHYANALSRVDDAMQTMDIICDDYVKLLEKDDCDSRDKRRSLGVTALACMFTVAKSCFPALAYLEEVRVCMANLEDDAATTLKKGVIRVQNYPFPPSVMPRILLNLLIQRLFFGLRNWIVNMSSGLQVMMIKERTAQHSNAWKPCLTKGLRGL